MHTTSPRRRAAGLGGLTRQSSFGPIAHAKVAEETNDIPHWINQTRSDVLATSEWSSFTSVLYDEVKKYLRRNHISSFTDLSVDEREHLIQEIEKSLGNTSQYHDFTNSLNMCLETRLSKYVQNETPNAKTSDLKRAARDASAQAAANAAAAADEFGLDAVGVVSRPSSATVDSSPQFTSPALKDMSQRNGFNIADRAASTSMLECLVSTASTAAVAILESFDDVKEELKMLFNTRFPTAIRRFLWRFKLRNDVHHLRYTDIFASEHQSTVSPADAEIARVCAMIVDTQFPSLAVDPIFVTTLTSLVSFSDVIRKNGLEYWLPYTAIPLLAVFSELYNNRALLVEYFFQIQQMQVDILYSNEDQRNQQKTGALLSNTTSNSFGSTNEKEKALFRTLDKMLDTHSHDVFEHVRAILTKASTTHAVPVSRSGAADDTDLPDGAVFSQDQTAANLAFVQEFHFMKIELERNATSVDLLFGVFCRKAILQLLVGVLNLDAVIFVWDQCLVLGFEALLPVYLCATIQCLKEQILAAQSLPALWRVVYHQGFSVTWRSLQRVVKHEFLETVEQIHHIEPRDDKLWHEMERGMRHPQNTLLKPALQPDDHQDVGKALRALGVFNARGKPVHASKSTRKTKNLWTKKARFVRTMAGARLSAQNVLQDDSEADAQDSSEDAAPQQRSETASSQLSPEQLAEEEYFFMPPTEAEVAAHRKKNKADTSGTDNGKPNPPIFHTISVPVHSEQGSASALDLVIPRPFTTASMPKTTAALSKVVPRYPDAVEPQDRLQDLALRVVEVNAAAIISALGNTTTPQKVKFVANLRAALHAAVPGIRDDMSPAGPLLSLEYSEVQNDGGARTATNTPDTTNEVVTRINVILKTGASLDRSSCRLHFHVFKNGARDEAPLLPEEKAALHSLIEFEVRRTRVLERVRRRLTASMSNRTDADDGNVWDENTFSCPAVGQAILIFSQRTLRAAKEKMIRSWTLRGTVARLQRTIRRRLLWRSLRGLWKSIPPSNAAIAKLQKLQTAVVAQLWRENFPLQSDPHWGPGRRVNDRVLSVRLPPGPGLVSAQGLGKNAVGLGSASTVSPVLDDTIDIYAFRTLPQLQDVQVGMYVLSCAQKRLSHLTPTECAQQLVASQHKMRTAHLSWEPDIVVKAPAGPLGLVVQRESEHQSLLITAFQAVNPNGATGALQAGGTALPGHSIVHMAAADDHATGVDLIDIDNSASTDADGEKHMSDFATFLRDHSGREKILVLRTICSASTLQTFGVEMPPKPIRSEPAAWLGYTASTTTTAGNNSTSRRESETMASSSVPPARQTEAEAAAAAAERASRQPLSPDNADFFAAARRRRTRQGADESTAIQSIHAALMGTRLLLLGTDSELQACLELAAGEQEATMDTPMDVAFGEKFQRKYLKKQFKGAQAQREANDGYTVETPEAFRTRLANQDPDTLEQQTKVLQNEQLRLRKRFESTVKRDVDKRKRDHEAALRRRRR